jgi:hypothetical protein
MLSNGLGGATSRPPAKLQNVPMRPSASRTFYVSTVLDDLDA